MAATPDKCPPSITSTTCPWPLIPDGVLVISGIAQGSEVLQTLFSVGWPLILVFVGLLILAGATGLTGRGSGSDESELR